MPSRSPPASRSSAPSTSAPASRSTRGRVQTSAQKTGHGGARKGAGRKRSRLPADVRERVGHPPVRDPLGQAAWSREVTMQLYDLYLDGEPVKELLQLAMRFDATIARTTPVNVLHGARRRLERDERDVRETEAGGPVTLRKDDRVGQRSRAVRRDT